jgi:hypothetical protein
MKHPGDSATCELILRRQEINFVAQRSNLRIALAMLARWARRY